MHKEFRGGGLRGPWGWGLRSNFGAPFLYVYVLFRGMTIANNFKSCCGACACFLVRTYTFRGHSIRKLEEGGSEMGVRALVAQPLDPHYSGIGHRCTQKICSIAAEGGEREGVLQLKLPSA